MLRRPLLIPTLWFTLGILLTEYLKFPLTAAWALGGTGLGGQLHFLTSRRPKPWVGVLAPAWVAVTALALGALAHGIAREIKAPTHLAHLTSAAPELGTLRGEIAEPATLRLLERRGHLTASTAVRIWATDWQPRRAKWNPASGWVLITVRGPLPVGAFRGRTVEAFGTLQAPAPTDGPGLFDYQGFLGRQDIHRLFQVDKADDILLAPYAGNPPWSERFLPWAHAALCRGIPDDEAARLLRAMTLGWKTPLNGEVDDVFMRAGTMHVFAISGLHIALLMAMVVQLFRALRLSRFWAGAVALPLTWAYVAATGWQPSAIRSAIMASVILIGTALHRPSDILNSLAAAAALILVMEPDQLFESGFQLSFGAVAGLALITPPLERCFLSWIAFDPWIPDALRPRWQQRMAVPLRALAMNLAVGVAALLSTLPLTVHHFNLLSPISLAANLLVVPLSSLALAATTASLAVAPMAPGLSEIFNASGWLWMRGMIDLSYWFAHWPCAWWSVAAPAWWWWIGWYAAIGLVLHVTAHAGSWSDVREQSKSPANRVWAGAVGLWGLAAVIAAWSYHRTPRLFVFRQEPCLFSQTPSGTAVFDGGRPGTVARQLAPLLRASGVNQLQAHVVCQGIQRFGGIGPELLAEMPPARVWTPNSTASHQPQFRRYLDLVENSHIPIARAAFQKEIAGWTVVAPDESTANFSRRRAADYATALRGEFAGVRVLWLGGAGTAIQRELTSRPERAAADVVITVANAGVDPLPPDLVRAITPRLAIIVTGAFPVAAQIAPAVRLRLRSSTFPVLFTDENGGIELRFSRGQIHWQGFGARTDLGPEPPIPPALKSAVHEDAGASDAERPVDRELGE